MRMKVFFFTTHSLCLRTDTMRGAGRITMSKAGNSLPSYRGDCLGKTDNKVIRKRQAKGDS